MLPGLRPQRDGRRRLGTGSTGEPDDGGARRDRGLLLQELPQAQKQAIVLTKIEGLSVSEAAARTGASESAIKVQVHRGLKRLAAMVRQES